MLKSQKSIASSLYLFGASIFFVGSLFFHKLSVLNNVAIDRQTYSFLPRASLIRFMDIGLHRGIADLLWIHTLMESDLSHYTKSDLSSWIYLRLREITVFDTRFWEAYYYGSEYLMIVKNDLSGAHDLLKKGLSAFPNDFGLNYKMGYLLAIEMRNPKEAFFYFNKVKGHPQRPLIFDTILTKLAYSSLSIAETRLLVEENLKSHQPNTPVYLRLRHQLYTLKAVEDLECLNRGNKSCNTRDLNEVEYVKHSGQWKSKTDLLPMNLHYLDQKKGD